MELDFRAYEKRLNFAMRHLILVLASAVSAP